MPQLYLIYGSDEYMVSDKAKSIVDQLVPESERALQLEQVDALVDTGDDAAAAIRRAVEGLRTVGLFGGAKTVWLKDANFLSDTRTGKTIAVKEALESLTAVVKAGLPPDINLVVSASAAHKGRAFYKAFKKAGEIHEFVMPDKAYQADKHAGGMLKQILADRGLSMASDVQTLFLELVGSDTRQLVSEVEKLSLYLGEGQPATRQTVEEVTCSTREAVSWDLADAFGARDLARALGLIRQLLFQKQSAIGLVVGLENRIRELIIYREALDRGWLKEGYGGGRGSSYKWAELDPETDSWFTSHLKTDPRKIHPFRVGILAEQARSFSLPELRKGLTIVTDAHESLVSTRVPAGMVLELSLIRMLGKSRAA